MTDLHAPPIAPGRTARGRRVLVFSALAGFALTVIWSAPFVDKVIGDNVTGAVIGHDPKAAIAGPLAGVLFAFASGLGGTFTACNIAALGAVAPLLGEPRPLRSRLMLALRPLAWLVAGMAAVSALYGVIAALFGTNMPQYSTASAAAGALSPRLVQSMVVFGIIGLVLIHLGLAALGIVKDPLEAAERRFPHARTAFMGVIIGAFLVGRPFGLYRQLFRDVADNGHPMYGAVAFVLQSLGNVVLLSLIFLVLTAVLGSRVQRWLAAEPGRAALLTASAFLVAGVFTFLYWDVRLLARTGVIWYPTLW
ncbi:hypothetical protein AB0G05_02360 [Nonomuraea wenchangensis]